jgi:hypothetical protein
MLFEPRETPDEERQHEIWRKLDRIDRRVGILTKIMLLAVCVAVGWVAYCIIGALLGLPEPLNLILGGAAGAVVVWRIEKAAAS